MEAHGKNSYEEILRKLQSIENEKQTLNLENTKLKVLAGMCAVCCMITVYCVSWKGL